MQYRVLMAVFAVITPVLAIIGGQGAYAATQSQASTTCTTPSYDLLTKFEDHSTFDRNTAFSWMIFQDGSNQWQILYNQTGTSPYNAVADQKYQFRKVSGVYQVFAPEYGVKTVISNDGNTHIATADFNQNYNAFVCGYRTHNVDYVDWDVAQYPTYTAPVDLCTNIEGTQETMPSGKEDPDNDKNCTDIPPPPTCTPPQIGTYPDCSDPPTDPPSSDGDNITFVQKISAVFAFGIGGLIAYAFRFVMYD